MPAVLTESAFIMWPQEEMLLRESGYRDHLATTMADGLERWAEKMRRIETGRP
jgi:N-acetylmuramoyl-L-alanine amidase